MCSRRSKLQDEFREGHPKSVAVPETTDIVRQLILQNQQSTLNINGTRIHSILHENFIVNRICSRWISHNLSIAQKRIVSIGQKKCFKNTIAVLRNTAMTS